MSLTTCKECGTEISTQADSCPKCGAVLKRKIGCLTYVLAGLAIPFIILAILVILAVIGIISSILLSPRAY